MLLRIKTVSCVLILVICSLAVVIAIPSLAFANSRFGHHSATVKHKKKRRHHRRHTPRRDLLTAYADALRNDPTFQQQVAEYLASKQATNQARAVLLPQLSLTAATTGSRQDSTFNGVNRFNSGNYSVTLTQTVFNATGFKALARAKFIVRSAAAQLAADQQDLIVRVARAYFDVLNAADILKYTDQQRRFLARQLWATKERYRLGHATITDVDQARGSYQLIRAEYVTARIDLYNRLQDLSQITGVRYAKLALLRAHVPLISPAPRNLNVWVDIANKQNIALHASRLNMMAAHEAIKEAQGGFWPTINAEASWTDTNGLGTVPGTAVAGAQNTRLGVYGLTATWSAFESGLTISQVNQSVAQYEAAVAEMHSAYLNAVAETRKAYIGVSDGARRVRRGQIAIKANRDALRYSEEGFRAGTQSIVDVLQTQTRLFDAEKQYTADLYTYIIDILLLKQSAGTLTPRDIGQLNSWLQTSARVDRRLFRYQYHRPKPKHVWYDYQWPHALPRASQRVKLVRFNQHRGFLLPAPHVMAHSSSKHHMRVKKRPIQYVLPRLKHKHAVQHQLARHVPALRPVSAKSIIHHRSHHTVKRQSIRPHQVLPKPQFTL